MGIVSTYAVFDGSAPKADRIAKEIEGVIGLPIKVEESVPENCGKFRDLDAHLTFATFQTNRIEITAYRPGAVREMLDQDGLSSMPLADRVWGANEPPGTQAVYVRGYVGEEPTMFLATCLALERLGGRIRNPLSPELRAEYDRRITIGDLERRHRKVARQNRRSMLLALLTMPIWVPLQVLSIGWFILTLPWRIRRGQRIAHQILASRVSQKPPPPASDTGATHG